MIAFDPSLIIVPIAVAIIAPAGAYFAASRKMSGKIGTSDASELWKESSLIREDYRDRLEASDARTRELEVRVAKLEGDKNDLTQENLTLKAEVYELKRNWAACQEAVGRLTTELEVYRGK